MVLFLMILVAFLSGGVCSSFAIRWALKQLPRDKNITKLRLRNSTKRTFPRINCDNSELDELIKDLEEVEQYLKFVFRKTLILHIFYVAAVVALLIIGVYQVSWMVPISLPNDAVYIFLGGLFAIVCMLCGAFMRGRIK